MRYLALALGVLLLGATAAGTARADCTSAHQTTAQLDHSEPTADQAKLPEQSQPQG